jgi:DNA-binding CsgD family transcriptional regulator
MQVRGIVLQTRKALVTRRFGAEAWAGLYRDVATAHPRLRAPVGQSSLLPLPTYLAFHDELMRRFFHDDESHFLLGAESARWMMKDGPRRRIRGGGGTSYHYLFHFVSSAGRANGSAIAPEQSRRAGQLLPSLTDREGEVLLLLAEGKTNDEIGGALGISGKTAQHHITAAYRKLGVSGRVGATAWLARHGLIGDDAAGRGRR